jgi:hypothetical protein
MKPGGKIADPCTRSDGHGTYAIAVATSNQSQAASKPAGRRIH